MTRENKPAAQSAARGAASLLTGALLLAGLTGCSGDLFLKGDSANANMKAKPAVALAPAQGVPDKYASKINEQLAVTMKTSGVSVVDAKDAAYTVKPIYVAEANGRHGTKVAYMIDVTDKAGNKVRSITGEEVVSGKRGGDPWRHVSDDAVQKVALKSATDLSAWIDNPNAPPPAPAVASAKAAEPVKAAAASSASAPVKSASVTPKASRAKPAPAAETASLASAVDDSAAAAPARPVQTAAVAPQEILAVVPIVSGAPGDGKTSLSDAMRKALGRQGVKLASTGAAAAYRIQGQVEMGAVSNGQQPITIRWVVIDPAGKQLEKTVVQNNKISAGSLDGAWGEVAEQAAGAAASEVSKLLNKGQAG